MRISDWSSDVCSSDLDPGPGCHAQHPAQEQPPFETVLQQAALPRAQPDRALLLQAEALPPRRHSLRQARRQLPGYGPARLNAAVASRLCVYGLDAPGLQLARARGREVDRSEEHTSELQSLMRNSYAVFCLKKKKQLLRKH